MNATTITINITGDKESFKELLEILKHAAETSENVTAEEALWDLHEQIAIETESL